MALFKLYKKFKSDESGQYAVLTAIFSIPLLLATSAAVDFSSASSEHKSVKDALDNAVLAAATNNGITLQKKRMIAKQHFHRNYKGRAKLTVAASAREDWVQLTANGLVPFSVSSALGLDGIEIKSRSKARRSEANVICVLALAETAKDSITFSGGIEFLAPNCSVHSNSKSPTALLSTSNRTPVAQSFCATGGVRGSFSPYAKGECLTVPDPYENLAEPPITPCVSEVKFKKKKGKNPPNIMMNVGGYEIDAGLGPGIGIVESNNLTGSNSTFYPGTYCGGITVDGRSVKFMPGDYVMLDGALTFKNGAQAVANDVTFAFKGKNSRLKIEENSDVTVKAPSIGPRQGIAFMEVADVTVKKKSKKNKAKEKKKNSNTISSGGNLNVIGTVYFPTQALVVHGKDSRLGANTPAVSFIAHTLDLDGDAGSRVLVQVKHKAADLPPIKPRAEEGAILVE